MLINEISKRRCQWQEQAPQHKLSIVDGGPRGTLASWHVKRGVRGRLGRMAFGSVGDWVAELDDAGLCLQKATQTSRRTACGAVGDMGTRRPVFAHRGRTIRHASYG